MSCYPMWAPPCPVPVCPEQIVYASENGNLNGVGVLSSNSASLGIFRGIVGDGTYISTALDAGNLSITVSLIPGAIPAAIPQATETVSGKGEVATQAETNAGVSDIAFVTPLKLGARVASMTQTGLIEIATQPETFTGTDNTRAITPLRLSEALGLLLVQQVWANAAARAAAVPDYTGQVGVQFDTNQVYTATGLAAGNWQQSYLQPNSLTTLTADTEVSLAGNAWIFSDGAVEQIRMDSGTMAFDGDITILSGANLNFATTTTLSINSVTVPALSLLGTSGTLGRLTSYPQASFLGSHSLVAWAIPTGTQDRTTFDTATVTLPELAERFLALLDDLNNLSIPSY